MKRIFVLMMLFAMVLFAGCLLNSDDSKKDDDKTDGTSQSAAHYMPFKTGASWTFSETETDYSENTPNTTTDTSTTTCTGQQTFGQYTYWLLTDDGSDPSYFRIDSNGNDVYQYGSDILDFSDYLPQETFKAISLDQSEILMFKFGSPAGTTWPIFSDTSTEEGYTLSVEVNGKYVGLETITTPAKQFTNCAQMDMNITTAYTISVQGFSQTVTTTSTFSMWFAPNVGPVKSYDVSFMDNEKMYEFVGLLTSYTIPQ